MTIMILYSLHLLIFFTIAGSIIMLYDMIAIGINVQWLTPFLMHQYFAACAGFFVLWLMLILFYALDRSVFFICEKEAKIGRQMLERDGP